MTFYPLSGMGADSFWDYNVMDTSGSEMSENFEYQQPELREPEKSETKKEKKVKVKKNKKEKNSEKKFRFIRKKEKKQETTEQLEQQLVLPKNNPQPKRAC